MHVVSRSVSAREKWLLYRRCVEESANRRWMASTGQEVRMWRALAIPAAVAVLGIGAMIGGLR